MTRSLAALLLIVSLMAGCTTVNPYYDASKKHHRPDGFNNNYIDNWREDQPSFLRWQRERFFATLPAQDASRVNIEQARRFSHLDWALDSPVADQRPEHPDGPPFLRPRLARELCGPKA
jgi:hypothetical protein